MGACNVNTGIWSLLLLFVLQNKKRRCLLVLLRVNGLGYWISTRLHIDIGIEHDITEYSLHSESPGAHLLPPSIPSPPPSLCNLSFDDPYLRHLHATRFPLLVVTLLSLLNVMIQSPYAHIKPREDVRISESAVFGPPFSRS